MFTYKKYITQAHPNKIHKYKTTLKIVFKLLKRQKTIEHLFQYLKLDERNRKFIGKFSSFDLRVWRSVVLDRSIFFNLFDWTKDFERSLDFDNVGVKVVVVDKDDDDCGDSISDFVSFDRKLQDNLLLSLTILEFFISWLDLALIDTSLVEMLELVERILKDFSWDGISNLGEDSLCPKHRPISSSVKGSVSFDDVSE